MLTQFHIPQDSGIHRILFERLLCGPLLQNRTVVSNQE